MAKEILNTTANRFEAFCDRVIAIILTLMVLNIRIANVDTNLSSSQVWLQLNPLLPSAVGYVLSFIMLGGLWVNHHQFFRQNKQNDRKIMWYNLNLLLWMSFIPVPTAFLGTNFLMPVATVLYGSVMFMCATSFALMR